jgi:hypothetical protein
VAPELIAVERRAAAWSSAHLPTDAEAEEAVAEQRVILVSFETQCHDWVAPELMDHAAAHANTHRRNMEAVRAAMAEAKQHLFWVDVARGLARVVVEHQRRELPYPLPSFDASAQQEEERRTFTSFLEEAERDRHDRAAEENYRCHGMVSGRRSDDGAGQSNAPPPPPSGSSGADEDHSFSLFYISPYYVKTIYISMKSA